MAEASVTIWHLEMTDPAALRPAAEPRLALALHQVTPPLPEFNRFLYAAVGRAWRWTDRLGWSFERWQAWADRAELRTYVAYSGGAPAGYFELERQNEDHVELAYFGCFAWVQGQGVGGWLLTQAIRQAWAWDARRVWVHTCSWDHPAALTNYQRRGFSLFRTEVQRQAIPADRANPW